MVTFLGFGKIETYFYNSRELFRDLEAVGRRCSLKTVFLKISQILQVFSCEICTSNHMFKREIWDKFTKFSFFILKFQKINEVNFPKI